MGRPEKPVDPDAGPVPRLAWQLRRLRDGAGNPSYRILARRAHYSASTLADAAKGDRLPSLEVTLAYAAACGGDPAEWQALWSAAAEAPAPRQAQELCPYQGLRAFQPEQAEWFFGRSALVDRLLATLDRQPLVGVYGASGSGKSSLLRAGLLGAVAADPRLADRWRPMLLTPTEHPLDALSDLVTKLSGTDRQVAHEELAADPAALDIAVRGALTGGPPDTRALLVVDQFEEVFTLCADREERRRFITALLDASQGEQRRATVVLGVRADFLAHLTQYSGLLDAEHLLVGPLTGAELREVVTQPAARAGVGVDPDLLSTLLADAADEPGALPLVSHAMLETWHRRDGATLTLAAYHASGGVRGAIAQTAERVHARFDAAERLTARRIFLRLTALGDGTEDTRRPIARTELDGVSDADATARVLDELAEARLVVLGDGTVEVAHEALIRAWPRLHRWLTDDRAGLLAHRRLTDAAQTWSSLRRDPGALLRGVQLAAARGLAEDRPAELNDLESAFLRASDALAESEQLGARRQARLLKRLVAGMAGLLVLALLGGGVAVRQRQDARRQQLVALAEEVSVRARSLLPTDPELAGLLAAEAEHLHPSVETRGSVLSASVAPRRTELNAGGPSVYGVAFNPDHTLLAAAVGDGTIGLWDPVRGTRVATLSGHTGRAAGVAFNGDGTRLASIGIDGTKGTVIVWDTATRQPLRRYEEPDPGSSIAFSADATRLATARTTGGIVVRDLRTGTSTVLAGQARPSLSLTFSADGKLLASADGHDAPRVWDLATGAVVADLAAERVVAVAFAATGYVLSGSADDRGVHLWDLAGGHPTPLPPLPLAGRYAWAASAPVGDRLAVADENGAVTVWDHRRGVPLQTFQDRGRTETVSVVLSPDGAFLASAGFNGTIVVHDLANQPYGGFTAQVKDVKASPDGTVVASAGSDGTVRLWDGAGRLTGTLGGHPDEVQAVAFAPDGHLLATVTRTNLVTIWDVRWQRPAAPPATATGSGVSTDIAFDGTLLATATLGLSLWNAQDLEHPADITAKFAPRIVTSLAFTPDGRRLVGASAGGYVNVWDVATGRQLSRFATGQTAVQDVAVSPDGTVLATAGDSRTVKLWDAGSGRELATLGGHTSPVQVLAFSRDGRRLASAGDDHTVIVWDVAARRALVTLTGHEARVRGLAFTAAGTLVSGAEDGRLISWSFDATAARTRLCTGRTLTPQEWTTHLPSVPYHPTCGSPPR